MIYTDPMFLKFINREVGVSDLLRSFSKSRDELTIKAVSQVIDNPPDLDQFRQEITDAVHDLINEGIGDEFKAFVNHYMENSIVEDLETSDTKYGESVSRMARVKDPDAQWIQGFICYNLCLYVRSFGLQDLKKCRMCDKLFAHRGKYAVYCSDKCKERAKLHGGKPRGATQESKKPDTPVSGMPSG